MSAQARGTRETLAAITDAAVFEQLATAALRRADPLYRATVHTGVNPQGKTVRAPVDNISLAQTDGRTCLVGAQHTTCAAAELRRKWLGSTKPARSALNGRRKHAEVPDLLKFASIVRSERAQGDGLSARLALTTNREPDEALVRDVERAAMLEDIEVDVWSNSRLADFLDFDPEGQWIRLHHLGAAPTRISAGLLREAGQASLAALPDFDAAEQWVPRELDGALHDALARGGVTFVIGASGTGKTTSCRKLLLRSLDEGAFALVISADEADLAGSVEQAIEAALIRSVPSLALGCGAAALALCIPSARLALLVEDVSRSRNPATVIERLASWRPPGSGSGPAPEWALLCPAWPQALTLARPEALKAIDAISVQATVFSEAEANAAVLRRIQAAGRQAGELEAAVIADQLGRDPLLIALHAGRNAAAATDVLDGYVEDAMVKVSAQVATLSSGDVAAALDMLFRASVFSGNPEPTWSDATAWLAPWPRALDALAAAMKEGSLVRPAVQVSAGPIAFRHDRIRMHLLARHLAGATTNGSLPTSVRADPFYAEALGMALSRLGCPTGVVDGLLVVNPLALFWALRHASGAMHAEHVAEALEGWTTGLLPHLPEHASLRRAALSVLAQTTSSRTASFVQRLDPGGMSPAAIEAYVRNSDPNGAFRVCAWAGLGSASPWRDSLVAHAAATDPTLPEILSRVLQTSAGEPVLLGAALRLAGHLGWSSLENAILDAWRSDADKTARLPDYLWAAIRCTDDAGCLEEICNHWASLSDEAGESQMSPRDGVTAWSLPHAFRRGMPEAAIRYLISRARGDQELNHQISWLLRTVDHPQSLQFLAEKAAILDGDGFSGWWFMHNMLTEWEERPRPSRDRMSAETRRELARTWLRPDAGMRMRFRTFQVWECTVDRDDLTTIAACRDEKGLEDALLAARLRRADATAVGLLRGRLGQDGADSRRRWWYLTRNLPLADLVDDLNRELSLRAADAGTGWFAEYPTDAILPELLMRLPRTESVELLHKHWSHLRWSGAFVAAALHTVSAKLAACVDAAVAECPDPAKLFAHITWNLGINVSNHPGLTEQAQIAALLPYVRHFDDFARDQICEFCNRRGWQEFRRRRLDDFVGVEVRRRHMVDSQAAIEALDGLVAKPSGIFLDQWTESFLASTPSHEALVDTVFAWLLQSTDPNSAWVAAALIGAVGDRGHMQRLVEAVNERPSQANTEALLADTAFKISLRTA